jgi:hypothetical protein
VFAPVLGEVLLSLALDGLLVVELVHAVGVVLSETGSNKGNFKL